MPEMQPSMRATGGESVVDFDIHGIVGIRLLDPARSVVKALTKQLGHFRASLDREPDITVRFATDITPTSMTYVGLNRAAFSGDDFFIVNKRTGVISAQVPMDQIGFQCEILCRRQRSTIPFLFETIRLTLLRKGYIPLHASAFEYEGTGVLVMGWNKGGKTEALLAFGKHDASYVGDEWVIVSSDGCEMFGLPVPVAIWDWQFPYIPDLLPKIRWQQRALFKGIHLLASINDMFARAGLNQRFPFEVLDEGIPLIKKRLRLKALPQEIFGGRYHKSKVKLDLLWLIMGHSDSAVTVEPCDGPDIARRMVYSNIDEQDDLLGMYEAFLFAFPERRNELIDNIEGRQLTLLQQAFTDKESYKVRHPYPVSLDLLFEKLQPFAGAG